MKIKMVVFKSMDFKTHFAVACVIAFILMALGCYYIFNDDSSFLLPLCLFVSSVMILSGTLITTCETSVVNILKKKEQNNRHCKQQMVH